MSAEQVAERICQFLGKLPGAVAYQMFNLFDSHDVPRLHNNEMIDDAAVENAILLMFTLPGTTNVYYGDEVAIDGKIDVVEFARYPMDWDWQIKEKAKERFAYYQKLCRIKTSSEALAEGSFQILYAKDKTLAFGRFTDKEMLVTISSMDAHESKVYLPLAEYGFAGKEAKELLGKEVEWTMTSEGMEVSVPAKGCCLLSIQ
jgi:alpha-glucosidase